MGEKKKTKGGCLCKTLTLKVNSGPSAKGATKHGEVVRTSVSNLEKLCTTGL